MPARIDRYVVRDILGRGGMGVVYRVTCIEDGLDYALKQLDVARGKQLDRFRREYQVMQRIEHPGLVRVTDYGEADGRPYYVMELVDGKPLAEAFFGPGGRPLAGLLPPTLPQILRACLLIRRVCKPLSTVHNKRVVHRDLKPSNILVFPGDRIKLTDFGLVKLEEAAVALTEDGAMIGTPSYMAPEIARGKSAAGEVDLRADLYSLGVILYQLSTGRKPFVGKNALEVIARQIRDEPVPPRKLNPAIPAALDSLICRLLEKDPNRRPADAFAVEMELGEIVETTMNAGTPAEPPPAAGSLELGSRRGFDKAELERRLSAAEGRVRQAEAQSDRLGLLRALSVVLECNRVRGELDRALVVSGRVAMALSDCEDADVHALGLAAVGLLRSDLGAHQPALDDLKQAGRVAQGGGLVSRLPAILFGASQVMARSGRTATAAQLFARVDSLSACLPDQWPVQSLARLWWLYLSDAKDGETQFEVERLVRVLACAPGVLTVYRAGLIAGMALRKLGKKLESVQMLQRTIALAEEAQIREDQVLALLELDRALREAGAEEEAEVASARAEAAALELVGRAGPYNRFLADWINRLRRSAGGLPADGGLLPGAALPLPGAR